MCDCGLYTRVNPHVCVDGVHPCKLLCEPVALMVLVEYVLPLLWEPLERVCLSACECAQGRHGCE